LISLLSIDEASTRGIDLPLTKVHGNQEEANKEVVMTVKTEAGANRRSNEVKGTVMEKEAGANGPSKELKETAKAEPGANRPREILKATVERWKYRRSDR
jgi:hypothetical protein